jgi:RimJ/RimL family protein N-acetyltransferase
MAPAAERRPHPVWGDQPTLSDGVIEIGPFELGDVATVIAWDSDPETQRWFDWPHTRPAGFDHEADARATVLEKWTAWETGEELAFMIRAAGTREALGWCDLQPRGSGRGQISYGLLPQHRRRGAASRAVALLAQFAFGTLGLARLQLKAGTANVASRAVAVRAGFREEGVMRGYGVYEHFEPLRGERYDMVLYSRLRDDRMPSPA